MHEGLNEKKTVVKYTVVHCFYTADGTAHKEHGHQMDEALTEEKKPPE